MTHNKDAPPSAPVGVEAFDARLRGRAGPFTAREGERYVDADIAQAVLREALTQQPAQAAPEYTQAMGEAAYRYIDSKCRMSDGSYAVSPPSFPGGFLWSELYDAMLAAAAATPGDDAAGGGS